MIQLERANIPKCYGMAPSVRVRRALERLSRDRWIPGNQVTRIAMILSKCASPGAWRTVMNAALQMESEVVGIINGNPPARRFEPDYGVFVNALYRKNFSGISGEFKIYSILLKRLK